MKTPLFIATLLVFAAVGALAQDTPPPPPPMDDAMMKFIEAMSPNDNHKKLEAFAGNWDIASTFWMDGPDKPPMTEKGGARITWALGGRFLRQEFKGTFMGMPMDGLGFLGYDNLKKAYTMSWMDNTSTAISTATGQFDEAGTDLTLNGKMDDPITGELNMDVKYVFRKSDRDRYVFEMHQVPAKGPSVKMGEMVYTRSKEHN
jgi:hypothetical protein